MGLVDLGRWKMDSLRTAEGTSRLPVVNPGMAESLTKPFSFPGAQPIEPWPFVSVGRPATGAATRLPSSG